MSTEADVYSGAYLSLQVVEELDIPELDGFTTSLAHDLYASNDIFEVFDVSEVIDAQYDSTINGVTDLALQYTMAIQSKKNLVFEPSTLLEAPYYTAQQSSEVGTNL
jgi:hypothetical protein